MIGHAAFVEVVDNLTVNEHVRIITAVVYLYVVGIVHGEPTAADL